MKGTLLIYTSLILTVFSKKPNVIPEEEIQLSLLITIIRHGARTPVQIIRHDPNNAYWTVGKGQLTNIGKQELYALGQKFRNEYDTFLSDEYKPEEIMVKSTLRDRTIMSAQCFLAGLYPPKGTQVWNPDLAWQPIPVYLLDYDVDKVFGGLLNKAEKDCKENFGNAYDMIYERFKKIILMIENATGEHYGCLNKGFSLTVNTLVVENFYNLTLPFGLDLFLEEIFKLHEVTFVMKTTFPEIITTVNAPILEEIILHLEDHRNKNTSKKFFAYFVHDVNILPLLSGITYSELKPPLFAASLNIEVYRTRDNQHYVKVLHRKSPWLEAEDEIIRNCGKICPLNAFLSLVKTVAKPAVNITCPCYNIGWPPGPKKKKCGY